MTSRLAGSAAQCLENDHRTIDATLLEAETAARAGRFPDAGSHFAAFASRLTRHIEVEEQVLFPEVEGLVPAARGPTSVMRAEHRELADVIDRIGGELAAASPDWGTAFARLKETLVAHNVKEERVLYPMADAAAQAAGRGEALAEHVRAGLDAALR